MLDNFEPSKLAHAVRELAVVHTTRVDSLADGQGLEESEIARRLMDKLRRTPDSELVALVRALKPLERRFVGSLVAAEDEVVRVKAFRICFHRPDLARVRPLLASLNRYLHHGTAKLAATLLLDRAPLQEQLSRLQARLCAGRRNSPADAALKYWATLAEERPSFTASAEAGDFIVGSALHDELGAHVLLKGDVDEWCFLSEPEFSALFDVQAVETKIRALLHAHTIFQTVDPVTAVADPKIQFLLVLLKRREDIVEALEEISPEAMQWYRTLWSAHELSSFFDHVPDSERFEFWKQYLPLLKFVEGDAENMRLFLDFGRFGIIEFAESGNASYVYETDYFYKMVEKNRQRQLIHGQLKSKSHAVARLSHSKYWQTRFREKIQDLRWRYA